MKTLYNKLYHKIKQIIAFSLSFCVIHIHAQSDTCKVPWIPPAFSVSETHWEVPQSFWHNGGHTPENTINGDTTDYARAHIKATGSVTLRISDDTEGSLYASGGFVGFVVRCRAFPDTIFDGVTITTYLDGTFQESYTGDQLWVEYIPQHVNDPICLGYWTTLPWNEIEITVDTAGGKVHYDIFYAVIQGPCTSELPPLPITWLSFEVQKKGEASNLKWITAQEFNQAGFHVERSADGRLFESIGYMEASGSGNLNEYSFMDYDPLHGVNYYRIMGLDKEGLTSYSLVRSINFGQISEVIIWPNPAVGNIQIAIPKEISTSGEIRLVNEAGVVLLTKSFGEYEDDGTLDIHRIEPGFYSLIIDSPHSRHVDKIIVLK